MRQEGRRSLPDESRKQVEANDDEKVQVYFLPNLMTAGNLACGFFALTWIFQYKTEEGFEKIHIAIRLILAAFAFDFLDGRMARLMKRQSQFGREFDSLADIVSFGVAPAFLVYRIVLFQFERTGWAIAAVYLVCGGIRLARFNVLRARPTAAAHGREFIGFPIPSAAAVVVSVALFMMWLAGHDRALGPSRWLLPGLMVLLSILMVSNVRYPTFKYIDWTLQKHVAAFATVVVAALGIVLFKEVMLAVVFVVYMLYGLIRPWVSKRWRREIEPDEEDEQTAED